MKRIGRKKKEKNIPEKRASVIPGSDRESSSSLFFTFLKIGAFTIGGAYAMIPLIQKEVVQRRKWITGEDFMDGLSASQSSPGPIAVNLSVYVGYHVMGYKGMLLAVLGTILPSLFAILIIASFFDIIADLESVRRIFHALKPAVTALIAVPVINMCMAKGVNWKSLWLAVLAAIAVGIYQFNPIYLILLTLEYALIEANVRPALRHSRENGNPAKENK